jgi:TonB family protein
MIKGTIVLCLALVAVFFLRRRSAALRHRILAAAIVCAALVPFAEPLVPAWHVAVFQAPAAGPAQPLTLTDTTVQAAPSAAPTDAKGTRLSRLIPSLRAIWGLGAGISLLLLAGGLWRLMRIARRARPIGDGRWSAAAADLAGRFGLGRPLVILQTPHPTLLFTWGLRRPMVLLPAEAGGWSDERIRVVLGHELAHIRRGDWAMHLLAECVRAVYWFNPLAWIACDRLRLESEHACDDAVLRLGVAAPAYAAELVDLARLFRRSRRALLPAPAMARPSDLERRIRIMLNPHLDRSPVGRVSGWVVVVTCVALTATLAGLSLTAASAPPAVQVGPVASASPSPADSPTVVPSPSTTSADAAPARPEPMPRPVPTAARPSPVPDRQTGPTAEIVVTITDQFGRLVPNAVVTFSSDVPQLGAEGRTGSEGQFAASRLTPGTYQVSVSKPGFKRVHPRPISVDGGKKMETWFKLELGSLQETVWVSAAAGGVASTSPAVPVARQVGGPPASDPCAETQEGGCVMPPRKLADAKPIYPASSAAAGVSGTVVIHARLLADGSVGDLKPEPGSDADFADAAMQAIRLWTFSPVRLDGVAVPVDLTVTVQFEITK